jgi:phosphate transport system substrate-binding protein
MDETWQAVHLPATQRLFITLDCDMTRFVVLTTPHEREYIVKMTRFGRTAAIASAVAVSALLLSACSGGGSSSGLSGDLAGAGSSAQGSAQESWIAAFQTANEKVNITYDPSGSGAGRTQFIAGGVAFAGSDSYLSDDELKSTFVGCAPSTLPFEVPNYISPIAVIYNVEGVKTLNLDAATLAKIFSGKITKWNDAAIAALNAGVTLPDLAITAVHRSDKSGTTKNFTDYLNKVDAADWAEKAADVFPFKTGEGAQGTSGVVSAVKNGKGTIGYADLSKAAGLGVANIKVGDKFVAPTAEGASKVVAESTVVSGRDAADLAFKINRTTTDSTHYPLVLVSYIIGCQTYADAKIAPLVKAYATYLVSPEGQAVAAKAAGSAPLTAELSKKATDIVAAIK